MFKNTYIEVKIHFRRHVISNNMYFSITMYPLSIRERARACATKSRIDLHKVQLRYASARHQGFAQCENSSFDEKGMRVIDFKREQHSLWTYAKMLPHLQPTMLMTLIC